MVPKYSRRKLQATVIGDASADNVKYALGCQIGKILGELNFVVVTGGRGGVMEAVSKGAWEAGALTIGILPGDDINQANEYCKVVIPTGMGHARNVITALACDVLISIGGGAGTLSELALGWIHDKPIYVIGSQGGWSQKLGQTKIDDRREDNIILCENIDILRERLISFSQQ